jgi:GTP-binding protein
VPGGPISTYLEKRRPLRVVVSIIDAEVGPTPDDMHTLDYLNAKVPRILVAATKIDRIPKAKRKPRLQALAEQLEIPLDMLMPFSSTEKLGVDETWQALLSAVGERG